MPPSSARTLARFRLSVRSKSLAGFQAWVARPSAVFSMTSTYLDRSCGPDGPATIGRVALQEPRRRHELNAMSFRTIVLMFI
ncbi:hypothetical protein ACN28E_54395 [Archangium lansingense]|uniref:hypothetical protein n=1 Tax=Archangium lansingense TaxID=2995310 RepID=UPI003B7B56B9